MRRSGCSAPRTAGRTSRRPSCSSGSAMTVAPEGCVANPSLGSRWRKPAFRRDAQRGEPVVPARVNAVIGTLVAAAAPGPVKGACRPRHGVSIRLTRSEEVLRRDQAERAAQTGAPGTAHGVKPGGRRWTTTIRCPGRTDGRQEICRPLCPGAGLPPKTWSSLNGDPTTGREPGGDPCENDRGRIRSRPSSATSRPTSMPA